MATHGRHAHSPSDISGSVAAFLVFLLDLVRHVSGSAARSFSRSAKLGRYLARLMNNASPSVETCDISMGLHVGGPGCF